MAGGHCRLGTESSNGSFDGGKSSSSIGFFAFSGSAQANESLHQGSGMFVSSHVHRFPKCS